MTSLSWNHSKFYLLQYEIISCLIPSITYYYSVHNKCKYNTHTDMKLFEFLNFSWVSAVIAVYSLRLLLYSTYICKLYVAMDI